LLSFVYFLAGNDVLGFSVVVGAGFYGSFGSFLILTTGFGSTVGFVIGGRTIPGLSS
jgi:hypothetical protein